MSSMNIPGREEFEPNTAPVRTAITGTPYSPQAARDVIEKATMDAIQSYHHVLNDPESSDTAKIAAAKAIIDLGHNSKLPNLNITTQEQNIAQFIADVIRDAKYAKPTPTTVQPYIAPADTAPSELDAALDPLHTKSNP